MPSLSVKEAYLLTFTAMAWGAGLKLFNTHLRADCSPFLRPGRSVEVSMHHLYPLSLCPTPGHWCSKIEACVHIWYPSFCGCCPGDSSLDSLALLTSRACVHRFKRTNNPKRSTLRHIIITMSKVKDKEKILKAVIGKQTYIQGNFVRLSDFSAETLQAGREWHDMTYSQSTERKKMPNQVYSTWQSYPSRQVKVKGFHHH